MRRILVVAGSELGHVLPHLAVAQALRDQGHRVWFYAERDAASLVARAGCRFIPGFGALRRQMHRCRTTEELIAVLARAARVSAEAVLAVIRRQRIQAVVTNAMYAGGALAAERSGLPWASLATTPSLLHPSTALAAHARLDLGPLRRRLGLSPSEQSSADQGVSPQLHLLPWPGAFDVGPCARSAQHVGPLVWDVPGEEPPSWLDTLDPDQPLVLASTSTVPMAGDARGAARRVQALVAGLGRLPVQGVVTLPHAGYPMPARLPRNVRVERFTPHAFLVPRARALITHGGWGTVSRALVAAVPMLLVPSAFDQPLNASLCEEVGVGRSLLPVELTAQRLVSRLRPLLASGGPMRSVCRRIARESARLGGGSAAAHLLLREL